MFPKTDKMKWKQKPNSCFPFSPKAFGRKNEVKKTLLELLS
jgi:hypothetical protein